MDRLLASVHIQSGFSSEWVSLFVSPQPFYIRRFVTSQSFTTNTAFNHRTHRPNELSILPGSFKTIVDQVKPKVVFGKGSDIDSIGMCLDQSGKTATDAKRVEMPVRFKTASLERYELLTGNELTAIVDLVLES